MRTSRAVYVLVAVGVALFVVLAPFFAGDHATYDGVDAKRSMQHPEPRAEIDRRQQANAIGSQQSNAPAQSISKAPWSRGTAALERREYEALVAAARSSPSSGSYTLAAKALAACANLRATHQKTLSSIEGEPRNKDVRRKALEELERPCIGFGDLKEIVTLRDSLWEEGEKAGDALAALGITAGKLADSKMPREERQGKALDILALQDGEAFLSLRATLTAKGASFDGARIPDVDLGTYGTALGMAACEQYNVSCRGVNSTSSLKDCALHGDCDYEDQMQGLQRHLPPAMYEKAGKYYLRIRDRLSQGQFPAFGVP